LVVVTDEWNLRTRVRGFKSFGDFRGRKKGFESLAKDSVVWRLVFQLNKYFCSTKIKNQVQICRFFSGFMELFRK
jgi:hypothetical protein